MQIRIPALVKIEGGKFWMGSQPAAYPSEAPYHEVAVASFYLGVFPVTELEFESFTNSRQMQKTDNPTPISLHQSSQNCPGDRGVPLHDVTWNTAVSYCQWLSEAIGKVFRLPTEAEWEYAAKAGNNLKYPTATGGISETLANYGNCHGHVTTVGTYSPNPWGLYDMAGNVWEWCSSKKGDYVDDRCIRSYDYPYVKHDGREDTDSSDASRVLRGGCYSNRAVHCRSAARYREFEYLSSNYHPSRGKNTFGFRVAVSA